MYHFNRSRRHLSIQRSGLRSTSTQKEKFEQKHTIRHFITHSTVGSRPLEIALHLN